MAAGGCSSGLTLSKAPDLYVILGNSMPINLLKCTVGIPLVSLFARLQPHGPTMNRMQVRAGSSRVGRVIAILIVATLVIFGLLVALPDQGYSHITGWNRSSRPQEGALYASGSKWLAGSDYGHVRVTLSQ